MEYVLYGEDTTGQMHRDVEGRLQSYSTCQLRKEELGVCTSRISVYKLMEDRQVLRSSNFTILSYSIRELRCIRP